MPLEELLPRLLKGVSGPRCFLSAYLDLRPDASGKKNYPVFLKSRLSELSARFPAHSSAQTCFSKDSKQMQKFLLEKLDPSWKGVALFACTAEDLFLSVPLPFPPANRLEMAPGPILFPLVRDSDLFKTYGIVAADSRQARLFLERLSRVEKQLTLSWEDTHFTRFGRMGLSTQRFQRHQKEHLKQRAKEIVENMERWLNLDHAEYLFQVAEEEMAGELLKQWSAVAKKKLVVLPGMDTREPDHKILAAASSLLQSITRGKAELLARKVLEEAAPLGQGAVGPEPTLSALQNHQAERIVLDSQFQASGWACERCGDLGSGGTPTACPTCAGTIRSADLAEETIYKAKLQGLPLFFTHNFSPLLKAGGVACMLKYKTTLKSPKSKYIAPR